MRIAVIQVASPVDEPIAERRTRVARMVENAAGCDLIVLPELWAVGYFAFDHYATSAESCDGRTVSDAQYWARRLHAHILAGSYVERDQTGHLHNTTVFVGPDGRVLNQYRKVHVFGYESLEAELLTPGTSVSAVETPFGAVGVTTCYDLRFPEIWRGLVDAGAEIAVTPAAWPISRMEHWRLFTQARAVENQMLLVACNAVGTQGDVQLGGHSRVVDPWGNVLVEAGTSEGITSVVVDPSIVGDTRRTFPVLEDRYPSFVTNGSEPTAWVVKGTPS